MFFATTRLLVSLQLLLFTTTGVLATPDFPLNLSHDGPYLYTANVPGCIKGIGPTYTLNWTSANELKFCAVGWGIGTNRTINYDGYYSPSGNSIFSVYGWTRNPLVEYNVVQSAGTYVAVGATLKGTATCNDQRYDILQGTDYSLPSIDGTKPFTQYWSRRWNRQYQNIKGTIDMDCHFKAWESFGMKLGTHDFQLAAVESYYSSVNATVHIISP